MKPYTDEDLARWHSMVGQKVWKNPKTTSKFQPKPFKSGFKVNTVKAVVVHEQTGRPGFMFVEDESVVECFRCSIAPTEFKFDNVGPRGTMTMEVFAAMKIDDGFVPTFRHEGLIIRG